MIRWCKWSWKEEHSSVEDGLQATDISEYSDVVAIEVVEHSARVVRVLGCGRVFVGGRGDGRGSVHIEELDYADKVLQAYAEIRQQLSTVQDVMLFQDVAGAEPLIALEERLVREAAEAMVRHPIDNPITHGCGFTLMQSYLNGMTVTAVFDEEQGMLLGVIRKGHREVADHLCGRYAVLDLMDLAYENTFEYVYAEEEAALKALRFVARAYPLAEVAAALKKSRLLTKDEGIIR